MGTLVVIFGPTGAGKTQLSIEVAKAFGVPILSCDSRQFYQEMKIGTAPPSPEQLAAVKHYFVADRSLQEPNTAGRYEDEALHLLEQLFKTYPLVLMVGGTGLYIDAVCRGMDQTPAGDPLIRTALEAELAEKGIVVLFEKLKQLDPDFADEIDRNNPMRVLRALEVCLVTGRPYSKIRTNSVKHRDFDICKIGITCERSQLYERINRRVDEMIESGLEQEARTLYPFRHINTLNTVGYREWFDYFEGKTDREQAIELIKRNTRRYAKRQMTWFGRYSDATWFTAEQSEQIIRHIQSYISATKPC